MAAAMVATAPQLSSSVGLLAMLEEDEPEIKLHALTKLNAIAGDFWAEISEALPDIESLFEDEEFPQRPLAALVASKVYYYLGEVGDALTYALGAGSLFNVEERSEYVETLLAKAIDRMFERRRKNVEVEAAGECSDGGILATCGLSSVARVITASASSGRRRSCSSLATAT